MRGEERKSYDLLADRALTTADLPIPATDPDPQAAAERLILGRRHPGRPGPHGSRRLGRSRHHQRPGPDRQLRALGKAETALAGVSLVLGVVALALAETAVAEVLLAVLMASILIVWAVELMDHAGILPGVGHRTGLRYS